MQKYAAERGRPDFNAAHFVEHYNVAGWQDKGGNPVRNWKQKVLTWVQRGGKTALSPPAARVPAESISREYTEEEADRLLEKMKAR